MRFARLIALSLSLPLVAQAQDYTAYAASLPEPLRAFHLDADDDGWSNGLEYFFGTQALEPTPRVAAPGQIDLVPFEGAPHARMRFTLPSPLPPDVVIRLETSDDLADWTTLGERKPAAAAWTGSRAFDEAPAGAGAGQTTVEMHEPHPGGPAPKRFYRIVLIHEPDSDFDGMPDRFETTHGLQPASPDAHGDADGEGLSNLDEYLNGTNPNLADTDRDGDLDAYEIAAGRDPVESTGTSPTTPTAVTALLVFTPVPGP